MKSVNKIKVVIQIFQDILELLQGVVYPNTRLIHEVEIQMAMLEWVLEGESDSGPSENTESETHRMKFDIDSLGIDIVDFVLATLLATFSSKGIPVDYMPEDWGNSGRDKCYTYAREKLTEFVNARCKNQPIVKESFDFKHGEEISVSQDGIAYVPRTFVAKGNGKYICYASPTEANEFYNEFYGDAVASRPTTIPWKYARKLHV